MAASQPKICMTVKNIIVPGMPVANRTVIFFQVKKINGSAAQNNRIARNLVLNMFFNRHES